THSLPLHFFRHASKMSRRFLVHLPRPQIEEESCQHQPNHGTPPNEVARIDALDVQTTKRKQRRYREDDETHNQAVNDSDIAYRIAGAAKQHRTDHEHHPTHFFQEEQQQGRNFGLRRVYKYPDDESSVAENHEQSADRKQHRENAQCYLQSAIRWL